MITYQTNVWEKDWKYVLKKSYLSQIINRCQTNFNEKTIIVNNVKNRPLVESRLAKLKKEGIIDTYYFVEDYLNEVLIHFSLTKEDFKGAYYVSISELVGIYLCKNKYLLYFKGDSHLPANNHRWIANGLAMLLEREDVFVVNPTWNGRFEEVKNQSSSEASNFHLGYGFSDQCFLIRSADFKRQIYNEWHESSSVFPGGNPFEAMVNSYMRNHNLLRATHQYDYYIHENFKESWSLQNLPIVMPNYLKARLNMI
jgi:hypothetical protein